MHVIAVARSPGMSCIKELSCYQGFTRTGLYSIYLVPGTWYRHIQTASIRPDSCLLVRALLSVPIVQGTCYLLK